MFTTHNINLINSIIIVLTSYVILIYILYTIKHNKRKEVFDMAQTNISIRIDEDIKKEAEDLFIRLGLNMSAAVNVFFRQAVTEQAIPFQIRTKNNDEKYNEYFNEYNMKILMESMEQVKNGNVVIKTLAELESMENE